MITAVFAFVGSLLGTVVGAYIFYSSNGERYDEDYSYRNSGHSGPNN
jgi:zinc transporter ZupT